MLKKYNNFFEIAFLTALFCFAVSLFNLSGYIFSAIVLVMFLLYSHKIRLTTMDLWLVLFSALYFFFHWLHFGADINAVILYLVGPWSAYILGKLYVEQSKKKRPFMILLLVLSLGMYLHGLLNVVAYVRSEHFLLYQYYRQSVDFWRNELVNVKTTEMLYTFATGIGLGVLFTTYKARYKLLASVVLVLSLLLTIFMANRALLIIFVFVFLWRLFCWFADARVSSSKKTLIILFGAILLSIVVGMIALNIAGTGEEFFSLRLVQRFISTNELTRFDVWNIFMDDFQFIRYPMGGKLMTQYSEWGYLHNMWLDVYNVVGVIPFVILLVISVKAIANLRRFNRVLKCNNLKNEAIIFQSLLLATFLNMMIEPIIEANPYYFLMSLMFLGAMDGYVHKLNSLEHRNLNEHL